MTKIEFLQVSAKNWFGNSQQHRVFCSLQAGARAKVIDLLKPA